MGASASKSAAMRTPPARFVAKQLPRRNEDVVEEFKKAKHTIQGINKAKEHVNTTPQPYVEVGFNDESTMNLDNHAPKWYMNAFLELADNLKEDQVIVTGNLPFAWERDKFEPYALVRNRIDDEDSDWLLSPETKNQPLDVLIEQTKLERQALEDILATVEIPRRQFRNYQGKLHKAVEDGNQFLTDRKAKIEEAREDELLRDIGYTDEEIADDRQYRTIRPRGVKTLDQLGVSIREKRRADRAKQHDDMAMMLEQRKNEAIEAGDYVPDEEDLGYEVEKLKMQSGSSRYVKARINKEKRVFSNDIGANQYTMSRVSWWANRKRDIPHGPDHIPDATVYNERLSMTEEQTTKDIEEAKEYSKAVNAAQGNKTWQDPQDEYNVMMRAIRENKDREDQMKMQLEKAQASIKSPGPGRKTRITGFPEELSGGSGAAWLSGEDFSHERLKHRNREPAPPPNQEQPGDKDGEGPKKE